ncbi:MAG: hypothetical protein QXW65_00805 [Candidatus Pacearchaeota archaeon]
MRVSKNIEELFEKHISEKARQNRKKEEENNLINYSFNYPLNSVPSSILKELGEKNDKEVSDLSRQIKYHIPYYLQKA